MAERKRIPEWARNERNSDMAWIREYLHVFIPAVIEAFAKEGRGAIMVDTTQRPTGEGHPFGYVTQTIVEAQDDDMKRLVHEYEPQVEFVVMMIKLDDRISSYRIRPLPRDGYTWHGNVPRVGLGSHL